MFLVLRVLDLVPHEVSTWFPLVAHMALAMVGFLLGESFVGKDLKQTGPVVLWVSLGETFLTAVLVFVALLAVGTPVVFALLLSGIAPASAPAATIDIVKEGGARGPLTKTVLGVVAIDDAWGVILFSVLLVVAQVIAGSEAHASEILAGLWEVVGAVILGGVLGFPMAWLTGRLKKGEPALVEAAGFVFLCGGLAIVLDVSYLLACMVLGVVVANRARHYTRPFHAIEGVSEPFLAVFFLLAGFRFELDTLLTLGLIGGVYVLARSSGLILGGKLGAWLGNAPPVVRARIGWCLLPQAGVALGLALLVYERFPEIGALILPLTIATTVLFELIGPVLIHWHLRKAGEL